MVQTENLSPQQARFLVALFTSRTITDACAMSGISRRTVDGWRKTDVFQAAIVAREDEMLGDVTRSTMGVLPAAQAVLIKTMADETVSAGVRVRAATALIDFGLRLIEVRNFAKRLEALEAANGTT